MDECLKVLALFNKRAKLLYLNGYTKFQILNELKIFHELIDENKVAKIDLNNSIFKNANDKLQLNRKIDQHYCNELYFNENNDDLFFKINDVCKTVDGEKSEYFKLIDEFLDNPRIKPITDITLSNSISIYDKPLFETKITKQSYLNLINNIEEDLQKNIIDNKEDNLLLYENAFLNLEYSIYKVKDRVEIYQELIILICKLSNLYNLEAGILIQYFYIYINKMIRDLMFINDNDLLFTVTKTIYNNIDFNSFFLILPFFLENFSPNYIKILLKKIDKDIFFKKDENYKIIRNILMFSGADLSSYLVALEENEGLDEYSKNLSLLEFAINFESRDVVTYYWEKIYNSESQFGYEDIIEDLKEIVDNFERIEILVNHLTKLSKEDISKKLIEVEQLNYLSRKAYSCALNRTYYYYFDLKSLNFDFLLILLNLGLEDKASIYFYHNINYINWEKENLENIFINANILFLINCFDFSSEVLIRLYKYLKNDKTSDNSKLFSYVQLELPLLNNLLIPLLNDQKWNDVLEDNDIKDII